MEQQTFSNRLKKAISSDWLSTLLFIAAVAATYFLIQGFLIRTYQVDGQSMETTLQNGDRLIIDKVPRTLSRITKRAYIPHRGDIIVFNLPGINFGTGDDKQLIKRVVGLPGERVVVKNGSLTIYGPGQSGGFEPDKIGLYHINAPATAGDVDITLGSDEIFVCGDNRSNSEDSRYFGPIKASQVVGKLSLRLMPLNKVQTY